MTDGIPAVTTVLTTQLPLSLRDSPVMKTEDDYCRLGHARSLLSLDSIYEHVDSAGTNRLLSRQRPATAEETATNDHRLAAHRSQPTSTYPVLGDHSPPLAEAPFRQKFSRC